MRRPQNRTPLTDPDDERHGSLNGYTHGRCRCDSCRAAWTAYFRLYRARGRLPRESPDRAAAAHAAFQAARAARGVPAEGVLT